MGELSQYFFTFDIKSVAFNLGIRSSIWFFFLWFKICYSLLFTNICTLNILDMKSDMFLVSYRECMVKLVLNYFQVIDILIYDYLKIRIHMKYDNNNKNFINHVMYIYFFLYISTVCCIIGCKQFKNCLILFILTITWRKCEVGADI